jgi:hypothetical protein
VWRRGVFAGMIKFTFHKCQKILKIATKVMTSIDKQGITIDGEGMAFLLYLVVFEHKYKNK